MAEFPSEKAKVSCRVYGKVMLSKNYTKHLKDFHKSENASNKRGKDQMSAPMIVLLLVGEIRQLQNITYVMMILPVRRNLIVLQYKM